VGKTLADSTGYLCNQCHFPFGVLSNERERGVEILAANKKLITRIIKDTKGN